MGSRLLSPSDQLESFARFVRRFSVTRGTLGGFFDASRSVILGRAPGRLDVMGGIADYSGSLVLELPIREGAFAAAQSEADGFVRIASVTPDGTEPSRELAIPVRELGAGCEAARAWFTRTPGASWGAYVGGALALLAERGSVFRGARLLISSSVPEGKGVASSAAIAVASLVSASAELGPSLEPRDVALAAQRVENLIAGAPSGVMDPMTAALGEDGKLLELLCQPALVRGHIDIPAGVRFFGIDSGVRHAVSGADYGLVRVAAFMGYRILAEREGFSCTSVGERVVIDDSKYGGYLANVPRELLSRHSDALPERLRGVEFLKRYGGTTDAVTHVDPEATYPVRAATFHPVLEHERVSAFARTLGQGVDAKALRMLGGLMAASHASYGECGLGSDGTDLLVELVGAAAPSEGLFGAKITGGGSGGTVAVLARAGTERAIERIASDYTKKTGRGALVFGGSSPGAAAFGTYRLSPDGGLARL